MKFFQSKRRGETDAPLHLPGQRKIIDLLARHFAEAASEVNSSLDDSSLKLQVSKPVKTTEQIEGKGVETLRLVVQNATCGLSIRAQGENTVTAYLLPSAQLVLVPQTEYSSRLKFKLQRGDSNEWRFDGRPLTDTELRMLVLTITNDILKYSASDGAATIADGARIRIGELSLTTGLRDLLFEKAQLVSDLVNQQEALNGYLSGELHDCVIADLLFLKRELSSGRELPVERICGAIDNVVENLRGVCADLSSRELRDWGLSHSLIELSQRVSERSGQRIEATVADLPKKLSYECALQIYRIAQEVINNAVKHAQAKTIRLTLACSARDLCLAVEDDGVGFSSLADRHSKHGGMGLPLLKERSEILASLGLPSSIAIDSIPDKGTKIVLTVDLSRVAE